jgi:hypothetical protein
MAEMNLRIVVAGQKGARCEFTCPLESGDVQWLIAAAIADQGGFVTSMPEPYTIPMKPGDWIRTSVGPVYLTVEFPNPQQEVPLERTES